MFMFFHSFLFIYFLSFRIFWCAIFMSTSTSMPVIKLDCVRRKMHNNNHNNHNNNNNNDGNDNNTTTNNNLDCGWTLKLFLTGMWHSLAALLPLRCSLCDAHFVCTYRRMPVVTGDSTTRLLDSFAVQWFDLENPEEVTCPGEYNIKCNAFQASAVGRGPLAVDSRGPRADVYFRFACFQLSSGWRSLSVAESECLVLARRSCCCRCHRALLDFVLYARF